MFEALLANPASRTLMRKLLAGAGMPFNEEAFEEQIKDSTYFNLAIAPILRKMPPQKLAVLADLQVRTGPLACCACCVLADLQEGAWLYAVASNSHGPKVAGHLVRDVVLRGVSVRCFEPNAAKCMYACREMLLATVSTHCQARVHEASRHADN